MFRVNIPKSTMLNHTILIMTQLQWAWDFILYQSFFQPRSAAAAAAQCSDDGLGVRNYTRKIDSGENCDECAVCLCGIDDGDEIRELRCNHAFHRACLDRWLGYGHGTCPLCRINVRPRRFEAAELSRELVVLNFAAVEASAEDDDNATWWLR